MDTLTELTGSSLTPEEINKRIIGSLVHKNMDIRNLNLMRNIGKYPLYNFPMFPEIGMVYNVYEHLLNRPVRHYTTGNTSWSKWKSGLAGQFNTNPDGFLGDDTRAINGLIEFNNDITQDLDGGTSSFHLVIDGDREKVVYTPNSGSMGLEGGAGLLSTVKAKINEEFAKRKSYVYKGKFGLDNYGEPCEPDGTSNAMVGRGESIGQPKYYVQGDKETIKTDSGIAGYSPTISGILFHKEQDSDDKANEIKIDESLKDNFVNNSFISLDRNTADEWNSSLLNKTNRLFETGKIKSLINRYQTQDGLSRGRALLSGTSEGDAMWTNENADGYNNPWCRVWTVTKQFSTMKDLIRPFVRDNKAFYRIAEIQEEMFKNRPGLRPNGGGERLDAMGVLQSNGLPIFSPYQNDDGTIAEDSVKRCMFSIENLAWRDVKAEHKMKFGLKDDDLTTYVETETLTKEQRGPNGGRIMWFPPYNLKFTENVSAKWNNNSFLGRGEDIYTYGNTERGGTLSFTLLIDHPMVVDTWHNTARGYTDGRNVDNGLGERRILRFFAGCDEFLNDNAEPEKKSENKEVNDENKNTPIKETKPEFEEVSILIPLFFPNNYSGVDDRDNGQMKPFINYMFHGVDENDITEYRDKLLGLAKTVYKTLTENVKVPFSVALEKVQNEEEKPKREKYETDEDWEEQKEKYENIDKEMTLSLRDFSIYIINKIPDIYEFTSDNPEHITLSSIAKHIEERVDTFYESTNSLINEIELDLEAYEYSKTIFGTVASESLKYVKESYGSERFESKTNFMLDYEKTLPTDKNSGLINDHLYESNPNPNEGSNLITPIPYTGGKPLDTAEGYGYHYWHYKIDERVAGESQRRVWEDNKYYVPQGDFYKEVTDGVANNWDTKDFGLNNFKEVDADFEKEYGTAFAKFKINKLIYGTNLFSITNFINVLEKPYSELSPVEKHLEHILNDYVDNITGIDILGHASSQGNINGNNDLSRDRAKTLEMLLRLHDNLEEFNTNFIPLQEGKDLSEIPDISDKTHKLRRVSIGVIHFKLDDENAFNELGGVNSVTARPDSDNKTDISGVNNTEIKKEENSTGNIDNEETEITKVWNYDDEYKYFQRIKATDNIIKSRIIEKIQYFDPAYHSISPEGFNARLTFLHQCTRQGPSFLGDASNMAFGRAPYCVLRIGDFYNTKIIIDSISIDYGENQWDLNPEGAGVQPIMANVQLNFKFIGGSDISGPIDRLQNAISFNYYGNASIYDRRADYRSGFIDDDVSGVKSWDPEMKEIKKK